jgi:hypothetical protein
MPRLFAALALARGDGRYAKLLRTLARVDLLILDDWGPEQLTAEQRRDLLEIVEDRCDARSIIITSQLPVERWYEIIGEPTLADAILDRIVHSAYRIALAGDSMRKLKTVAQAEPEARASAKEAARGAGALFALYQVGVIFPSENPTHIKANSIANSIKNENGAFVPQLDADLLRALIAGEPEHAKRGVQWDSIMK